MKPFNFHELGWNDLFANGVFFVADILLVVILLPIILARIENRKWLKARQRIAEAAMKYVWGQGSIINVVHFKMSEYDKDFLLPNLKPDIFKFEMDVSDYLRNEIEYRKNAEVIYLNSLQILMPAFNSEIAIASSSAFQLISETFKKLHLIISSAIIFHKNIDLIVQGKPSDLMLLFSPVSRSGERLGQLSKDFDDLISSFEAVNSQLTSLAIACGKPKKADDPNSLSGQIATVRSFEKYLLERVGLARDAIKIGNKPKD